jgi:hypothetical protein
MAKKGNVIGAWAFLIGVILAIIIGFLISFSSTMLSGKAYTIVLSILVVLGILIGLLNIVAKESSKFLLAALSLVIVSFMGQSYLSIIPAVGAILNMLLVMFVPATIIVALKTAFEVAKN